MTGDGYDAAWNSVAVASVAYEQERANMAATLRCARCTAGLTPEDLCGASGLDEATVLRFLGEID
jgi:hypothetical protein